MIGTSKLIISVMYFTKVLKSHIGPLHDPSIIENLLDKALNHPLNNIEDYKCT